jgi:hypothetical protein
MAALVAGPSMVLSHNIWSGGALPAVVTLLGLRGRLLLMLPHETILGGFEMSRFGDLFYLYGTIPLVLGLCLAYAGSTAPVGAGDQYR